MSQQFSPRVPYPVYGPSTRTPRNSSHGGPGLSDVIRDLDDVSVHVSPTYHDAQHESNASPSLGQADSAKRSDPSHASSNHVFYGAGPYLQGSSPHTNGNDHNESPNAQHPGGTHEWNPYSQEAQYGADHYNMQPGGPAFDGMMPLPYVVDAEAVEDPNRPLDIKTFLKRNPNLDGLKKARDSFLGWTRYLAAAIFAFLLFVPVLGMVTRLKTYAWVIIFLWIIVAIITIFWCEYRCRAELWYICIYRGIILDFKKTHELKQWALHPVMFLAYAFVFIAAIIVAAAATELDTWNRIVSGVLFAVGLLFVISLTKDFILLEGAPRLLTVNLVLFYMKNTTLLKAKGFKVVHYTQLSKYILAMKGSELESFSWNSVYELTEEAVAMAKNPTWGVKGNYFLRKVKDVDH